MDNSGKLLICKNSEIIQANTKILAGIFKFIFKIYQDSCTNDGEILSLITKELGTCEIFPQKLIHSPNGKFFLIFINDI